MNQKILIIEDEPIISSDIIAQLYKCGNYNVEAIDNGDQINSDCVGKYDLILCNHKLSNGWIDQLLINKLRQMSEHIVFITGIRECEKKNKSNQRDQYEILYKPFSFYQLKKVLQQNGIAY